MAIYKSRKRESGNGMTGMMGTQRIRVGTRGMNVGMRGTIQLLWAAARLLVTRFLPCLPSE